LTFAPHIDGPNVGDDSLSRAEEEVIKVYRGIDMGNNQLENLSDAPFWGGIRKRDFPVFIPSPIILEPWDGGVEDKRPPAVTVEGFQAGVHGYVTALIGADHRCQQGQGRRELDKPGRIAGRPDVDILGIHQSVGTDLHVR
jgi:hypothetical protein